MDCFTVLMEHEVTVYSLTTGTDSGGGVSNSFSVRAAGVKCLLNVQGTGEEELFGQTQTTRTVVAATFYTGAQRGDKLVVTAGPSLVGVSLHITAFKDQPGLAALGFDELVHLTTKQIL
jgi:hypothetical protein